MGRSLIPIKMQEFYTIAVLNTRVVGRHTARLIKRLDCVWNKETCHHEHSLQKRTHMIGFSLGAHVAGVAGNNLGHLARITGEKMRRKRQTT